MTLLLSITCFFICFAPAFSIFLRLVSKDPIRVILFVLGAFFWLVSLLFSSIIWAVLAQPSPPIASLISFPFQELARGLYYFLLHKTQSGLAKLANADTSTGSKFAHSSRHIMAIVCGLGMGVMAALFLLLNILFGIMTDGVAGLPGITHQSISSLQTSIYSPIYFSLSCGILIILNICWTISLWDGLHKYCYLDTTKEPWVAPIVVSVLSHLLCTIIVISLHSIILLKIALLCALLIGSIVYCSSIIRRVPPFLRSPYSAELVEEIEH